MKFMPWTKSWAIATIAIYIIRATFIVINFFFVYRKLRRDNSQLKEQVLDLGYSAGVQKNILTKEINSKKDEDYETEFI